jgi:hypothetical protein
MTGAFINRLPPDEGPATGLGAFRQAILNAKTQ